MSDFPLLPPRHYHNNFTRFATSILRPILKMPDMVGLATLLFLFPLWYFLAFIIMVALTIVGYKSDHPNWDYSNTDKAAFALLIVASFLSLIWGFVFIKDIWKKKTRRAAAGIVFILLLASGIL